MPICLRFLRNAYDFADLEKEGQIYLLTKTVIT